MANDQEIKIKITGQDDASPTLQAAMDKLTQSVNILAQAQLAGGQAAKQSKQEHDDLKVGLINVTAAFTLVKGAAEIAMHAFHAIEQQLEKAIDEALEFEKANNRLTGALVSTGQYTSELNDEINEYVESVEAASGANGELVKNMISTGIQMGLSVEKAKEMEEAARKLAAATGKDVNEAFSLLQRSLSGQSRGLAQVMPQIKEFGAAQLKQGAAIDVVNSALDAQYKLYEQSLPAAISKAKTSVDNVYKAFGLIITQSGLSKLALGAFTDAMKSLEHGIVSVDHWLTTNKQTLIDVGGAILNVGKILGGLVVAYGATTVAMGILDAILLAQAVGFGVAATAAWGLVAPIVAIALPITGAVVAVGALTYALYRWPGLFDVIIGGFKSLIGTAITPFASALGLVIASIGAAGEALGADWGAALTNAGTSLIGFKNSLTEAGDAQIQMGLDSITAGKQIQDSHEKNTEKAKEELAAQSQLNAVAAQRGKLYAEFDIGTEKEREQLAAKVAERDGDLKDFSDYLEAKKRIAISAKEEEQMELTKVQAKALEGSGGTAEKQGKANVAVDAEIKKQAELDTLYNEGVLSREEYNQATLASDQRAAQAELEFALAHKQERANLLGESEEGYAAKQDLENQRFELELQNKMARAEQENATDAEMKVVKEQAEMDHQVRINEIRESQIQNDIKRNEALHNNWGVTLGKIRLEQEKHGKFMGAIRGIQQSEEYRGAQQALTDLSSLRNSHSKKAFEVGKAAATAQATVNTFMAATAAYASLAGIPLVGPVLGAAAAAAAIAAGVANIQTIQSQKFNGGQADEGMDSIPGSLAGKSFVLSQGERVVQPSANKDLGDFLAREKAGATGTGGASYNITLNYGGTGGKEDAQKMADIVIDEIRSRSERGTPVMSERGLTKA